MGAQAVVRCTMMYHAIQFDRLPNRKDPQAFASPIGVSPSFARILPCNEPPGHLQVPLGHPEDKQTKANKSQLPKWRGHRSQCSLPMQGGLSLSIRSLGMLHLLVRATVDITRMRYPQFGTRTTTTGTAAQQHRKRTKRLRHVQSFSIENS